MQQSTTDLDRALGFAIPSRSARGRVVRLGPALDSVLAAHAYPPAIEALLAEALTLAALIGSTLKDPSGQLTMQTRTENGVVRLLVCDYRGGEVRGYIDYDADKFAEMPEKPTLFALFGQGYLAITFDLATTGERYQGIVPLDGDTLAQAAESYFVQSEQIPSLVSVGIARDGEGHTVAGGLFLQHLPEGEVGRERLHTRLDHPEWEHVEALGRTMGGRRTRRSGAAARDIGLAPVQRGGRGARTRLDTAVARLPLHRRLYRQRAREIHARGTARDGGREWADPGRLRVLRDQIPHSGGCRRGGVSHGANLHRMVRISR